MTGSHLCTRSLMSTSSHRHFAFSTFSPLLSQRSLPSLLRCSCACFTYAPYKHRIHTAAFTLI